MDYPTLDFSRYTMIIAHGNCPSQIETKRISSLKRVSDTELMLNIEIFRNSIATVVEHWCFALLVDKWDRLYNIDLNVDLREVIQ